MLPRLMKTSRRVNPCLKHLLIFKLRSDANTQKWLTWIFNMAKHESKKSPKYWEILNAFQFLINAQIYEWCFPRFISSRDIYAVKIISEIKRMRNGTHFDAIVFEKDSFNLAWKKKKNINISCDVVTENYNN